MYYTFEEKNDVLDHCDIIIIMEEKHDLYQTVWDPCDT